MLGQNVIVGGRELPQMKRLTHLLFAGPPHSTSPGQTFSLSQLQEQEEDVYPAALASAQRFNGHLQPTGAALGTPSRRVLPMQRSPVVANGRLADVDASTARRNSPPTPMTETTQRRTPRPGAQDTPRGREEEDSPNGVEASRNALLNNKHRAGSAGASKASRYSIAAPSTNGDDAASDDQEMDVQYDDQIDESLIQQPEMSSPAAPTKRINKNLNRQPSEVVGSPGSDDVQPADADEDEDVEQDMDVEPMQQEDEDEDEEEEVPVPKPKVKKGKGKADVKSAATTKRKPLADATNKRKGRPPRRDPDDEDDDASGDSAQARKRSRSAKVQREAVHKREHDSVQVVQHR